MIIGKNADLKTLILRYYIVTTLVQKYIKRHFLIDFSVGICQLTYKVKHKIKISTNLKDIYRIILKKIIIFLIIYNYSLANINLENW